MVRLVSPVNPVPQDVSRHMGVGRKGRPALPKAAEVCVVVEPPSVPTTPTWRSLADAAPGEQPESVSTVCTLLTQADVPEGLYMRACCHLVQDLRWHTCSVCRTALH